MIASFATHLVFVVVGGGCATVFKKPKAIVSNGIRFGWVVLLQVNRLTGSGFQIWRHIFNMAVTTSFHTETCCQLVNAYVAYVRRLFSRVSQFLIYSTGTFVLTIMGYKYL